MCSVEHRLRRVLIGLLLLSLLQVPQAAAESVETTATIHNGTPGFQAIDIVFDARLGAFLYDVRASDPNGVPDLDRLILHFQDADGRLWTHTDTEWDRDGASARWQGLAHVGLDLWRGPFEVHLHVYDRLDAEADADAPVTILSPILDEVREMREGDAPERSLLPTPSFLPLLSSAKVSAPPQLGLIVFVALTLGAAVLFAWRKTTPGRAPPGPPQALVRLKVPPQRPGGRPPGRS